MAGKGLSDFTQSLFCIQSPTSKAKCSQVHWSQFRSCPKRGFSKGVGGVGQRTEFKGFFKALRKAGCSDGFSSSSDFPVTFLLLFYLWCQTP